MEGDKFSQLEKMKHHIQKLEDDVEKLGLKIKHHEDNLKFLKMHKDQMDKTILCMKVKLEKYHSSTLDVASPNLPSLDYTQEKIGNMLQQEKTAAGVICQLQFRHGFQASKVPFMKNILGVVATLGKVENDKVSRLFSEYLGLETMQAIVCKTYEGVRALEKYNKEGMIDTSVGLQGLGQSIGRLIEGRYSVFCLDSLRPFIGEFERGDPQKRLALRKPRLPNGEPPPGFIGFAVNMIELDHSHLSCLTASGHGLRETLFYSLFSRVQVYSTRNDMQHAMPYITDGAISLDGGIIKSTGLFYLGSRKDVELKFPISSGSSGLPAEAIETEMQLKLINWKKERLLEDMQREETLLSSAKKLFSAKKEEYVNYLNESASTFK